MTPDDLRLVVAMKVDELADVLWQETDPTRREELHSLATDSLFERMTADTMRDTSALRDAFVRVAHEFWEREVGFSVKTPPRNVLRLVKKEGAA